MAEHEDAEFVMSQVKLASAYQAAGDLGQAIGLLEQTLADSQGSLGTESGHRGRAEQSRRGLPGGGGGAAGRPLLEQAVADTGRTLGTEHEVTLTFRNNLAAAYQDTGEVRLAIRLYEQVLAGQERVLGAEDPHTLLTRNNLARAYGAAGEVRRALPLLESVVADSEQLLGAAHPETLAYRNNLAGPTRRPVSLAGYCRCWYGGR